MRLSVQLLSRRPLLPRITLALAVALALLATGTPAWAQAKEASRVRILVTADTDAQGAMIFGLGLDGDNVKRVFDEQFARVGKTNRYTMDLYTGNQVSPLNILNYYNNLQSNPTETLVFYYTGHGIQDPNQGHLITTHKGVLPRKVLLEAMKKHNPQLVVLLTDCCANYIGGAPPFPAAKAGTVTGPQFTALRLLTAQLPTPPSIDERTRPKVNITAEPIQPGQPQAPDLLSNLFFQHKGLVDMNAAETGKSASGNANNGGSYYTVALVKELRKVIKDFDRNDDGFCEWREFFPHLDTETIAVSQKSGFFQRPQAFSLGEPMYQK